MKIASIDIGTNSFILLIVEFSNGKLNVLKQNFDIPRLGENLAKTKLVSDFALQRAITSIRKFKEIIATEKPDFILPVATAVLREALNGNEIRNLLSFELGFEIKVLTGEQESFLSFLGATFDNLQDNEIVTTIDIGGGSSELLLGSNNRIFKKISFPIGASKLQEMYFPNFDYSENQISLATDFLTSNLASAIDFFSNKIIGIGGTVTSLAFILSESEVYDKQIIDKIIIDFDTNYNLFKTLSKLTPDELSRNYKLNPKRADILLSGQLILLTFQNLLKKSPIYVSSKGLRFGVIIDFLKNSKLL